MFLSTCISQALAHTVEKSAVPCGGERRVIFGLAAERFLPLRSFDAARSAVRLHSRLAEEVGPFAELGQVRLGRLLGVHLKFFQAHG